MYIIHYCHASCLISIGLLKFVNLFTQYVVFAFLFCYYNSDFDCVHSILTLSIYIIKCVCGVSIQFKKKRRNIYCSKVYFYFIFRSLHTWFGFSKSQINVVVISVWFHTFVHHNNNITEQRVFGSVSNQFIENESKNNQPITSI